MSEGKGLVQPSCIVTFILAVCLSSESNSIYLSIPPLRHRETAEIGLAARPAS